MDARLEARMVNFLQFMNCGCHELDVDITTRLVLINNENDKHLDVLMEKFKKDEVSFAELQAELKTSYMTMFRRFDEAGMKHIPSREEIEKCSMEQAREIAKDRAMERAEAKTRAEAMAKAKAKAKVQAKAQAKAKAKAQAKQQPMKQQKKEEKQCSPPFMDDPARAERFANHMEFVKAAAPKGAVVCPQIELRRFNILDKLKMGLEEMWKRVDEGEMEEEEAKAKTYEMHVVMSNEMVEAKLMGPVSPPRGMLMEMAHSAAENYLKNRADEQKLAQAETEKELEAEVEASTEDEDAKGAAPQADPQTIVQLYELKLKSKDAEIRRLKHEMQGLTDENKELKDIIEAHEATEMARITGSQQGTSGADRVQAQLRDMALNAKK